jgi:pimeloyl-ACP methyl ester carboxylesterase
VVEIPFQGKKMYGYVFLRDNDGKARPSVISPSGYDGTAEEMLASIGLPALERGYNVLLFDAPGQGATLYDKDNRLYMRPDFEVPLSAVVDYAISRREFNNDKIAAYGISFGGYLVPRGVTKEHRIAALIADPGQCDIGLAIRKILPAKMVERIYDDSKGSENLFNKMIETTDGQLKILPRMAAHGAKTVKEFMMHSMDYRISPELLAQISCPSLICDNETDVISTGQGELLARHLQCPYEFVRFTEAEGAGGHSQTTGKQIFFQRAFDWLDELFDNTV